MRAGFTLIIIEPTDKMTVANAERLIADGLSGKHIKGLKLWAFAREGRVVNPEPYKTLEAERMDSVPLLSGIVGEWLLRKP